MQQRRNQMQQRRNQMQQRRDRLQQRRDRLQQRRNRSKNTVHIRLECKKYILDISTYETTL